MKKRLFAMLMACTMMTGIMAGCGSSSSSSSSSSSTSDEEVKITFIIASRDEFLSSLEQGAIDNAPDYVSFTTQDAQNDASKQLQMIEAARNAGTDAFVINLVDADAAEEVINAADGLPVVFVNRIPSDESLLGGNVVYVGSNERDAGTFQGEWLAEYYNAKGQTEISYIMLNGILGLTNTTYRTESALAALEAGGITATEATAPLACDWDRAEAMDRFTPLVGTLDFDCVISNNDAMALGAIEVLLQKGLDPADTPVVGIDATQDGCDAVLDGNMAMTVFQDPIGQGHASVYAAMNLAQGKDIADGTGFEKDETGNILWVPFELVTIDNVEDYM